MDTLVLTAEIIKYETYQNFTKGLYSKNRHSWPFSPETRYNSGAPRKRPLEYTISILVLAHTVAGPAVSGR